jgi:hypothetical protein
LHLNITAKCGPKFKSFKNMIYHNTILLCHKLFLDLRKQLPPSWSSSSTWCIISPSTRLLSHQGAVVAVIVWMVDGFKLPVQSVPINTNVVRSNPADGEVYSIQHYVMKFVSDMRQVCVFLPVRIFRFPPQ